MAIIVLTVVAFVGQIVTSTEPFPSGGLTDRLLLWAPDVADGEWWRIVTVALTHGSITHIVLNMLSLWIIGSIVEAALGPGRYLAIYIASIVWGSLGAILIEPGLASVGASGGVFGVFAGLAVLQLARRGRIGMDILTILGLNLVITFTVPGISKGGHLGGIVGGVIATAVILAVDARVRRSGSASGMMRVQSRSLAIVAASLVAVLGAVLAIAAARQGISL